MRLITLFTFTAAVVAAPAIDPGVPRFPLPDGFPTLNPDQLAEIQRLAGGTLPNQPLPTNLSQDAIATLKLLAHNELYEVAFFTELLTNITTAAPGYGSNDTAPLDRLLLVRQIEAIKNQEELHAVAANAFLISTKQEPIAPCQYTFPVSNFQNAILFAQVFTDLALGTIPAVQLLFARNGGPASRNVITLGSILGTEAQQDGFFRSTQRKNPSAAPFLTGSTGAIAFNALRKLIVKDSCPQPLSSIGLPEWGDLDYFSAQLFINNFIDSELAIPEPSWPYWISSNPQTTNGTLPFFVAGLSAAPNESSIVYLSGQNKPVAVPITKYLRSPGDASATFRADFPFEKGGFANGLTIAILARGLGPFADAEAVSAAAQLGPVVIEIH
ncbi:MAG: hypothetical protein Q9192_000965 [Flavoplaca navasiana]